MTTLTSLRSGHDVAYFLREREAGGCVGAMSYYTASGEPPGVWAGAAAAHLGLTISAVKSVSVLHASLKVAAGRTGDAELAPKPARNSQVRKYSNLYCAGIIFDE